jgi:hypothetical protein
MKTRMVAVFGSLALFGLLMASPVQAQSRMKACADEWNAMKAANQTAGKKYRDFQKECLARSAAAPGARTATGPATTPAAAPTTPAAAPTAAKGGGGRQAMVARERACGQEWKADKAANKVAAGMTWPKYWSECNKRKKAEGM